MRPGRAHRGSTRPGLDGFLLSRHYRTTLIRHGVSRIAVAIVVAAAALAVVGAANAAPPALLTVRQQDRHATAIFPAPGADLATIYVASKPDLASGGGFLEENIKRVDFLTADEIQRGAWLDGEQLEPGLYYVMLRTSDFECPRNPNCTQGYSNMVPLQVPKPRATYRASVLAFRHSGVIYLRLTVSRLGERLPYRVCWRLKNERRTCLTRMLNGYSWNRSATDTPRIRMRGMGRRTTFGWFVRGRRIAAQTVDTARP